MTDSEYRALFDNSPQNARRALFDEYFNYVFSIVYNRLRSCATREDVDECVSDVFSDIFLYCDDIGSFNGDLKGLIGTVANRKAVNMYRSLSAKNGRTIPIDEADTSRLTDGSSVAEEAEKSELRRVLTEKISQLGEPDSTIIIQKYYFNRSSKEIAKTVSLSPEAVRVRCGRAIKKLRKALSDEGFTLKGV